MMTITINGTDRTRLVVPSSIRISNVITSGPDTCDFTVRKFGARTYAPSVGEIVVIAQDGTTAFGGVVLEVKEDYDALDIVSYSVRCTDYSRYIDRRLVADTYENVTVEDIIADIRARYMPSDIDISHVDPGPLVKYVQFNYLYPSECLRQLAELTGSDWYIDYDKNLYFFQQNSQIAPFNLSDTGGNYVYNSLSIKRDMSQLRNTVFVRGSEFLGDTLTAAYVAENNQRHYLLPYKFHDLQCVVTGVEKDVGVDPIDDENLYDALYNFQEKMVKFRSGREPSSGSAVRISGQPYLPVIIKMSDPASVAQYTVHEYVIIDKNIKSKEGARQRAQMELLAYRATISECEFHTYTAGLHAGQRITVQSTLRDLDEEFIINRVETSVIGTDASDGTTHLLYKISLVTTRTFDYIQLLQKLLNKERSQIVVSDDEVLDTVESIMEEATISETVATAKEHNPLTEALSISEVVAANEDYGTIFVLGPFTPSTVYRLFICDGSRLT